MIFGQLASAATFFAKFHADTRKSLSDFWPSRLEQPIKFVLIRLNESENGAEDDLTS